MLTGSEHLMTAAIGGSLIQGQGAIVRGKERAVA